MERNSTKIVVDAHPKLLNLNLSEVLNYKDLIWLFVKRNFLTRYKQTILGPAWLLISPLFTIITYAIVFGQIANLSTDGIPQLAFYLAGNVVWNFFSGVLNDVSNTFTHNAGIFGKVYFPRLVMPISTTITKFFDFCIQLCLLFAFILYYNMNGQPIHMQATILLVPFVLLQIGFLGVGCGIIISSLTTKYRDLMVLVGFGLQMWLYASPVIYSITMIPEKLQKLYMLNPVTPGLLIFKNAFLGINSLPLKEWGISWIITLVILSIGIVIFNKVEKTFMDTI